MVRLKNRYLLVNILYPELESRKQNNSPIPDTVLFNQPTTDALTLQILTRALRAEVLNLFGDYGSGAVSESISSWSSIDVSPTRKLKKIVKYFSPATSTFILRVSRSHYRLAWAAMSLMTKVPVPDGKNCVFRVVRVSGTIRKAEEEAIRRARELILEARREMEGKDDSTLDTIFGKEGSKAKEDIMMVDASDSEGDG